MTATTGIRERVQAASSRVRALRRVDRAAAAVITLGGIGIVASVVGILLFVMAEAWPLFRPAQGHRLGTVALAAPPAYAAPVPSTGGPGRPVLTAQDDHALVTGVDEYQMYLYQVRADARVLFFRMADGAFARELPVPGLEHARITSASRTLSGDSVAVATSDGRVSLFRVSFKPKYQDQVLADLEIEIVPQGVVEIDAAHRPVLAVTHGADDAGQLSVAALLASDEIAVWRKGDAGETRATLRTSASDTLTAVRIGTVDRLIAGTEKGRVLHWELGDPPHLTSISPTGSSPITALAWILGDITFVAGNEAGELSAWFPVRLHEDDTELTIVRAHTYPTQGAPVDAIGASTRDKSFVTAGRDGSVTLRHMTSERTLLTLEGAGHPRAALLTPRGDGILAVQEDGSIARFQVTSPHPEITWHSLFGKTWYEGYPKPEYVWQSTGATNDFETKFSLVPLVFGTLKGTFYALLFAIPLALLGALYTSQFVHPEVRGKIKPTLEIMAALPSVVIGFIAGLWLASIVERWIVPVLLMTVLMPLCGTAGFLLWHRLPRGVAKRLKPGMELALILPLLLVGGWISVQLGPLVESVFFDGDFKLWLSTALGVTYDQRNSLVVGLAMGFAVIPIIFTIADDALSSVPSNLTAGSLALGASRWQTAVRVVLPTASPGIFSAVMIGFGRAVGETMIVLMATGNTPVLDWSIFNGMRTLSANVAVEIPEAPYGGTLYRTLFLSAALLFGMTFIVNTVAEVIRQRLRERYRAL